MNYLTLLIALLIAIIVMAVGFLVAEKSQRAGIVDALWSLLIAAGSLGFALIHDGHPYLRLFIGILSTLWFARLGLYLLKRYLNEAHEDSRYASMRQSMAEKASLGFFLFFIFQAVLSILFLIPMWLITQLNDISISAIIIAGLLMIGAFWGEKLADQQLYDFKAEPNNQGRVMDQGLWKFSRHPNYFFEWIHWFAYPILALASGIYWLWLFPFLMLFSLLFLSGIPFSEKQALLSKGEAYRDYQRKTSIFIPRPPKDI